MSSGTRYIFIVGLPRSGTTLLERILAAHPRVRTMGEIPTFPATLGRAVSSGDPDAHGNIALLQVSSLARVDWSAIAATYRRETAFLSDGAPFAIDKLPQNHLWVGAIRRTFPDAVIVHVEREPMDVLFGAFKLMLGSAHAWSNRMDHVAAHYRSYRALMQYWRSRSDSRLVEISLEALICDPDRQIRRLLEQCGLDFAQACLKPHLTRGPVATASSTQIRRPINTDGMGAWRRYASKLEPLRAGLEALGFVDARGSQVARLP